MQILHPTTLNDRDYVNKKGHEDATISSCPNHPGGGCAFHRHGTYSRKTPYGEALIARYYCRESHQTFSLLPVFFAARMPGTLAQMEGVVAELERDGTDLQEVRKVHGNRYIDDSSVWRWARRRQRHVQAFLTLVIGLFPQRFKGCQPTLESVRGRLRGDCFLVSARTLCSEYMQSLPMPVGLKPP